MTGARQNSRRAQVRQAEKVLCALLRTPKTRSGLIAAVTGKKISRNFVFGWLSQQLSTGVVLMHKSAIPITYQLASSVLEEKASPSEYPTWLEPRVLPVARARHVFSAGRNINDPRTKEQEDEDDDETDF